MAIQFTAGAWSVPFRATLLLATAIGGYSGVARAQGAPGASVDDGTIIVMARKRGEDIQAAPLAISAISGAQLEEQNVQRIDELDQLAPNIVISQTASYPNIANVYIRGIGTQNIGQSDDAPVALYYDGVYLGHSVGALLSVADFDHIEVLRGPQGTLNGRNSTGGAVSLFSRKPADTFGIEQKFSYGSFNDFVSRTALDTGVLGNTGISARIVYRHQNRNGYVNNRLVSGDQDPGAADADSVIAGVHGEWGDFTADYHFDYDRQDVVPSNTQIVSATTTVASYFGASRANGGAPFDYDGTVLKPGFVAISPRRLGEFDQKFWGKSRTRTEGHSLTLVAQLSDAIKLKSITGRRLTSSTSALIVGSYGQLRAPAGLNAVGTTVRDVDITVIPTINFRQSQWSEELQLLGSWTDVELVGGLYYFSEKYSQDYGNTLGAISTTASTATSGRYTTGTSFFTYSGTAKSKAAFAQVSWSPSALDGKLELTAGGRYTEDERTINQTQPANLVRNLRTSFDNLSGEFSAKYQWTPDAMAYLRIAQAYKSGGFGPRNSIGTGAFGPEKLISYEAGLKLDLLERVLRLNMAAFHSVYDDLQVSQNFSNSAATPCSLPVCSFTANAGKATYTGFEAEAVLRPTKGLSINGAVGYVEPKYKEFFLDPATNIAGQPGTHFPGVAKLTTNAGFNYVVPAGELGEFSIGANWSYRTQRWFTVYDTRSPNAAYVKAPHFHNVSARIGLSKIPVAGGEFDLAVYGNNLLNKFEVIQGADITSMGYVGFGPGRSFGASITGRF